MKENCLIAEFMGYEQFPDSYLHYCPPPNEEKVFDVRDMRYDTSWDWLMPVVEKIKKTKTGKYYNHAARLQAYMLDDLQSVNIGKVYKAVIKFIKWYNSQKL